MWMHGEYLDNFWFIGRWTKCVPYQNGESIKIYDDNFGKHPSMD